MSEVVNAASKVAELSAMLIQGCPEETVRSYALKMSELCLELRDEVRYQEDRNTRLLNENINLKGELRQAKEAAQAEPLEDDVFKRTK